MSGGSAAQHIPPRGDQLAHAERTFPDFKDPRSGRIVHFRLVGMTTLEIADKLGISSAEVMRLHREDQITAVVQELRRDEFQATRDVFRTLRRDALLYLSREMQHDDWKRAHSAAQTVLNYAAQRYGAELLAAEVGRPPMRMVPTGPVNATPPANDAKPIRTEAERRALIAAARAEHVKLLEPPKPEYEPELAEPRDRCDPA